MAMLTSLKVRNLALVDQVEMEFQPGLNVVTGETGAGKSVLLGALKLLLGDRADKSLIRTGEETCTVEGVFRLARPDAVDAVLEEIGLDPCEEGMLLLRRILKPAGSQHMVNDHAVTLATLKRIGDELVDMHGPHDHQSLFQPAAQVGVLDAFGGLEKSLAQYQQAYGELRDLELQKSELDGEGGTLVEQLDFLRFRVNEIREAGLSEEEEEAILREHGLVGNAQEIVELGGLAVSALSEEDGSALDRLAQAGNALEKLSRMMDEAGPLAEEVRGLAVQTREIGSALAALISDVEANPDRLDWLDQRLALYARMKKKYGPETRDVLQSLGEAEARLEDLSTRDEQLEKLDADIAGAQARLKKLGKTLSRKRGEVGKSLASAVQKELRVLGFHQSVFSVDIEPKEAGRLGIDKVDFQFAPNPGEPPRPLKAIASSGEMSRVMLAVKTVLARHDRVPVLVFDEIDANLGGEAGHVVGSKLSEAARSHQVLCITHLPQVAVFGTSHYAVTKQVKGKRTFTLVQHLASKERRVEEIARMLGGSGHTDVTEEHARALLSGASG